MVGDHLVEEIRARADVVELIGEYVSLKRSGKSYRGPCPLHGGDGANFSVDPDRQIFKCFVCGEAGDVFGFLMKHLGMTFPEVVRLVGARVGIEVPDREERREDPYAPLRSALAFAAEWYEAQLAGPLGASAREYLERRGLTSEDATQFGIGFAPDDWRALRTAALATGIEERVLLELGLLATSERAEESYDRFRGRLIFAIRDLRDRPIAFGARILDARSDAPKYLNSPESPVFHKGEELYGLNWARHSIRREERAAIVEGFTDVIALHRAGLPFAVAGLGTSFTRDQAQRLARYTKRAYLLYDSDGPGLRATFRTGDILLSAGVHPLVVTLPEGEDPDSLIRSGGPEKMHALFDDAVDLLERKLQILRREGYLDRIEGKRRAVDGLMSTLRAASDPALRDLYLDQTVKELGVLRETLVHDIASAPRPGTVARPVSRPTRGVPEVGGSMARGERNLVLLLVRDPELVRRAIRLGLEPKHFGDSNAREVFEAISMAADGGEELDDWSSLSADAKAFVEQLLETSEEVGEPVAVFEAFARRLRYGGHHDRRGAIDQEMELAEYDHQRRLLQEKQEVTAELRQAGDSASFIPGRGSRRPGSDRQRST